MSFYTSLKFYRPTKPPTVTGDTLAHFIRALADTGVFERRGAEYLHVKFGDAIDRDSQGPFIDIPDPENPLVSTMRSIEWDIDHEHVTLQDAAVVLSNHNRNVYRAMINLGSLRRDIVESVQTRRPDRDEMNLCLGDCSIMLGHVKLCTIGGEENFTVGWMELTISGYGYLLPWRPRDLTSRAASLDALRPVTDICRRFFPVPDGQRLVSRSDIALRHRMGELWPHADLQRDHDWVWGVEETG